MCYNNLFKLLTNYTKSRGKGKSAKEQLLVNVLLFVPSGLLPEPFPYPSPPIGRGQGKNPEGEKPWLGNLSQPTS